ncbi:hypothetical protein PR202_gb00896 [Eleusine coracana subsp. coracana]|uniref:LOB domain-containing protein n=1 Tax=Eleusine coracana subsp. coracana TaxID=191504 RepID=A0AAV5DT07_ELECO|nr:hypothetical protein QOZ80_5BG0424180 [Eleusine coracana subsp. coracana]GJN14113.1 hypothetical protein PR202_gb00896 [Eleusine coracana subsp. coracana]
MGSGSPCASCKLLRRRCTKDCIFAPFFPADDPHKFAIVHKVFGASNVSKMLQELPVQQRGDAVSSLVYEANARVRDPVYGCVGAISFLQNQVSQLQMQLAVAQAEILCFQMQRRDGDHHDGDAAVPPALGDHHHHHHVMAASQHQTMMAPEDVDAFLMHNGGGVVPPQLMAGYGAGDALKRESLWT